MDALLTPPRPRALTAPGTSAAQRWGFFAVIALGLLMVGLDNSILYTALPRLSEQLHATETQQLWIVNAYALVLSGLLLGTGALGDRIGHRRMYVLGLGVFGLASLTAALSPAVWALVLARALLGMGAAVMMPATLALIRLTFDDEIERNTAIGVWGSVAVVGAAAGPTVGGLLLEHFWWGSVFLVNVPVVALALTLWLAPPNVANPARRWDAPSSLYALVALSGLVMAIMSLARARWGLVAGAGGVSAAGGVLFVRRQNRLEEPLLTWDLFRSRVFTGGVITAGGAMFALAGTEMLTALRLQLVGGHSPLQAGLLISAVALAALSASALGGANLHRVGFLPLISGGFALLAAGLGTMWWAGRHDLTWLFLGAMVLTGVGAGAAMSVSSTAIIGAAPAHRAGMAAGVEEVSYELGTLLSVSVCGSLVTALMEQGLPAGLRGAGTEALSSPATREAAASAYDAGYLTTVGLLAVVVLALAGVTAWCFRDNPRSGGDDGAHE